MFKRGIFLLSHRVKTVFLEEFYSFTESVQNIKQNIMCSLFFPFATKLFLPDFPQPKPFTHAHYLPHCYRFLRLQMLVGIYFFKELWPSVWSGEEGRV